MSLRAALLTACMLVPALAHAQDKPSRLRSDEKAACLRAHVHGQELRIAGKWRAARTEFATCSAAACPSALSKDCVEWNAELAEKVPTMLVVARTPTGEDTLDASLEVDGEKRSDTLSGSAIDLDPGEHVLVLRHAGWTDVTKHVVLHEGDRDHRVEVAFTAASVEIKPAVVLPVLTPPPKKKGIPAASIALTVIGAFAVATGATLDVSGGVDYNFGCYGKCTSEQASSINTRFIAGDIALGTGIVLLGVALVVALTSKGH